MAYDLGSAVVRVEADTSSLGRGIDGAKLLLLGLGAAAAGAAGEALKLAGNFQAANEMLVTSAGEAQKNLAMISAGVLKTSTDTGTSTDQLEAAMYKIESAGLHGKSALDALKAAAEGAKLENSDLGIVADAETTLMVDYASKHVTATQAMNDLIATVARGKTNIQDLAASMASVLPTSSAVGVSLYDTSAAMATMTAEGTPAANAATYLRQMLLALEVPGSKAVTVFKEVGLTSKEVSDEMKKSLPDTLQMITDAIGKKFPEGSAAYVSALKDVAGGQKNFQAWLELTGQHLSVFKQNAEQVTQAVKQAGPAIDGWAQIQGNFNLQLDKAHAALDAVGIKLGTDLMPIVSQFISQDVLPAVQHFQAWEDQTHGVEHAFQALSSVAGAVIADVESLVSGIGNFVTGLQQGDPWVATLAGGLTAVGTAIGLIKLEEFAAGWYNTFQEMKAANGIIAGLASEALPNLGQALGWTKVAAQEVEQEVTQNVIPGFERFATQATASATTAKTEMAASATGMTGAFALATGAISISFGILAAAWLTTQQDITVGSHQMSASVKKDFDSLGTSAADNATSAKVKQTEAAHDTSTLIHQEASRSSGYWTSSYQKQKQDADDAKAQMILDQQKIADAAAAAAKKTEDAFNQMLLDLANEYGITVAQIQGLPTPKMPAYHGGRTTSVDTSRYGNDPLPTGSYGSNIPKPHASGGLIGPGELGFVAEPGTGGELVEGLPGGGARVYTGAESRGMLGGSGGGYGPLHLTLEIEGQSFGRVMVPYIAPGIVNHIRLKTGARV